jgi:hypothetical protein
MRRDGRYHAGRRRIVVAAIALAAISGPLATGIASADERPADVRALVTRWYVHGIPYAEANALGAGAVPELVSMLSEPAMEEHWTKVVWVLGCIGDSSATGTLIDFLKRQQGEISADTFRAALAVPLALGHLAREGDARALETLTSFTRSDAWKEAGLAFSYGRYKGEALGEVLGRTAIQGLGIAGTPAALGVLESMNRSDLRADWRDNVEEAMALNTLVGRVGPARAFAEEEKR